MRAPRSNTSGSGACELCFCLITVRLALKDRGESSFCGQSARVPLTGAQSGLPIRCHLDLQERVPRAVFVSYPQSCISEIRMSVSLLAVLLPHFSAAGGVRGSDGHARLQGRARISHATCRHRIGEWHAQRHSLSLHRFHAAL